MEPEVAKDFADVSDLTKRELHSRMFIIISRQEMVQWWLNQLPEIVEGEPDLKAEERQKFQTELAQLKTLAETLDKAIKRQKELLAVQEHKLELPTFGEEDDVDLKQLRLHVPCFDPTLTSVEFKHFWMKLKGFAEYRNYSEKGIKDALHNLLQGTAFEYFCGVMQKPLKQILEGLEMAFHCHETIEDLMVQLDTKKRQPGQTITNFMVEVGQLLVATQYARPDNPDMNKGYENAILHIKLMENCSEAARKAIKEAETKANQEGRGPLKYKDLLLIARDVEHRCSK